ncbi:MAG: CBS domain containing protein [Candidatus Yanofskybacteria bacterium GW2011_GWA2_44_9]|uniref:CBS domain containing protein n=1 Tax=Candidatus Yanofskybacteria bacterium GW2011_GWA2_44_9 TaxID=1619025 RepID=A0A0G1MP56_9BACT|nr:MAG: CBS domain containing protein [Candidatus Yanofskybacteria bacterium GW2011_GWA2_44_9]
MTENDPKNISKISINELMTREVITVNPETSLLDVAKVIAEHNFDGVPVVDKDGKLVGLVTEYDLINKTSAVHLPTLQVVLKNIPLFKQDQGHFQEEILSLKVKDIMNKEPLTLPNSSTFEDVIRLFKEHHRVNPIPVVDKDNRVVGVISRFDILRPFHVLQGVLKYF